MGATTRSPPVLPAHGLAAVTVRFHTVRDWFSKTRANGTNPLKTLPRMVRPARAMRVEHPNVTNRNTDLRRTESTWGRIR